VSSNDVSHTHAARYWPWVLGRAVPAVVVAIVITFSLDHSARLGFFSFGALALVGGAVLIAGAAAALGRGILRSMFLLQGVVSVLLGAVALIFPGAGVGLLLLLVGAWAAITGFAELYSGLRSRGRIDSAKDWIFAGSLTVLLAIVALLIPSGFSQPFTGPDGVARELTSSVILVGVIGAYGAILGIYLVIAGLSLKWADRSVAATAAESDSHRA
jgi:uncharacterized membrane protein HdeD (DUF308 family)